MQLCVCDYWIMQRCVCLVIKAIIRRYMWSYKSVINREWFVPGALCYEIEYNVNIDRSSSSEGTHTFAPRVYTK